VREADAVWATRDRDKPAFGDFAHVSLAFFGVRVPTHHNAGDIPQQDEHHYVQLTLVVVGRP
jgi:hypothetical protein